MGVRWLWLSVKILIVIVCALGGYFIASQINVFSGYTWAKWWGAGFGILFGGIVLALEKVIRMIPLKVILGGTFGLILGLFVARLIGGSFTSLQNPTVQVSVYVVLSCIFGYIGTVLGSIKFAELTTGLPWFGRITGKAASPKILDTSVIIDGRIADVAEAGFIEGPLIVPEFVLQELQHIADSQDQLRKAKGRRGLEVLKRLQDMPHMDVRIDKQAVQSGQDVDSMLVSLAEKLNAKILTNDYNLAKVAELHGIQVLNMHRLAHAMRPQVLPGETLRLQILKEGREEGQGIAYLEDGTMVVVENASKYLGQEVEAAVTSVLQTPGGRMIFTTLKSVQDGRQH
ncbi:PIN/TRAM domain-containing protein [Thermodesulforhabdus norvegica]|uniref:Uncharacterized conserved protein YacL, contains PIN and TRAM domains n=1 Tax=Thermodesulforhabdus norvegica TaxID=39841 RepID=A0A1I4W5M4_9BACT|nr:PIN domain-containing protein [Thermodesulforhabdus norvegica]SFN08908.1 Uncharacterized conserved protein YacL, contains PIN and TRAM domains [Thermodesulforhabdus norvegica]